MKRSIDAIEHAGEIMKKVNDAVLLTTKKDGRVNTMTISWGGMAIEWGKPLFITYVRESRFTKESPRCAVRSRVAIWTRLPSLDSRSKNPKR